MSTTEGFESWVGRVEEAGDTVTPGQAQSLAATLDLGPDATVAAGDPLPPLWHWLAFLPKAPMTELGPDGHPRRGGFLPPVPLERRMWAGGRLTFLDGLRIGEPLTRRSTIQAIKEKSGGAGRMVFVTVLHEVASERGLAIQEEQDIVYVAIPERFTPPPPVTPPSPILWEDPVAVDPVLLFRFSAVTFNGHRIHYDRTYATEVEHYPGLVVHGPLQAMLLMTAAMRHQGGAMPKGYQFRGVHPLFDDDALSLVGCPVSAVEDGAVAQPLAAVAGAAGPEAHVTMQARVSW